jgi:hypothetical protein
MDPPRPTSPLISNPLSSTTKSNRFQGNQTTPQPLLPPDGAKPSVHSSPLSRTGSTPPAKEATTPVAAPKEASAPTSVSKPISFVPLPAVAQPASAPVAAQAAQPGTAPVAAAQPAAFPTIPTSQGPRSIMPPAAGRAPTAAVVTAPASPTAATPEQPQATAAVTIPAAQVGKLAALKAALQGPKLVLAIILSALILVAGYFLLSAMADNRAAEEVSSIIERSKDGQSIPISRDNAASLVAQSTGVTSNLNRQRVFYTLSLATGEGGWDLDSYLIQEALRREMTPEVRADMLTSVIAPRATTQAVAPLLEFATGDPDSEAGKAALRATMKAADERHFGDFVDIISSQDSLRKDAEVVAAEIIAKQKDAKSLARRIISAYEATKSGTARQSFIRLLGRTGDSSAREIIDQALKSPEEPVRLSAILALQNWPNDSLFPALVDACITQESAIVRGKAFDAALSFLQANRERSSNADLWPTLIPQAESDRQKRAIITGLVNDSGNWRIKLVEGFTTGDHTDAVKDWAEKAIDKIKSTDK